MRQSLKNIFYFFRWIFVKGFALIFYDPKYLRGCWFEKLSSDGWRWAANDILHRIFLRRHIGICWPVSPYMECSRNIEFDPNDLDNFQSSGCYFQTYDAKISIGKGSFIAVNVGIITSNHDIYNLEEHTPGKDVILGEKCWIGMNSVILPGVTLGPRTIVGAGSVVTKSFSKGNVVIAGNPARVIRYIGDTDSESTQLGATAAPEDYHRASGKGLTFRS